METIQIKELESSLQLEVRDDIYSLHQGRFMFGLTYYGLLIIVK